MSGERFFGWFKCLASVFLAGLSVWRVVVDLLWWYCGLVGLQVVIDLLWYCCLVDWQVVIDLLAVVFCWFKCLVSGFFG